jgi:outer membrane protein assembly factor BamD
MGDARRTVSPRAHLRLGLALAFALCAGACASVPAYLSMEAEELWSTGNAAFERGDWDEAIERLERFVVVTPGDARAPEARILVARAYAGRGEYLTAASEYEVFLQLHPSHGLAPEASLGICQAYAALAPHPQRDQAYTVDAEEACGVTAFEFRGLSVAATADSIRLAMIDRLAEAAFQRAEFYERVNLYNSAVDYFEHVIAEYPDTPWAPRALLGVYHSYTALGWLPEAEETAARLLETYPGSAAAAELAAERDAEGLPPPGAGGGL